MIKKIFILSCCFFFMADIVCARALTVDSAILQLVNLTEQHEDWELHKQATIVENSKEITTFSLKKNLILSIKSNKVDSQISDITFILSADSAIEDKQLRTKKFITDELDIIEGALSIVGVSYDKNPALQKNLAETIGPLNVTMANSLGKKSTARLDGADAVLTAMYTKQGLYVLELSIIK